MLEAATARPLLASAVAPSRIASRPTNVIAALVFLAVPLTTCPWFWDRHSSAKWSVLTALAIAWFLTDLWGHRSHGSPVFVRRHWKACLVLAVLLLLSNLRSGPASAGPVVLDRATFVLLVLSSYWYFRRNRGWTGAIVLGAATAAAVVTGVGVAQLLAWQAPSIVSGGDQRSATFGNTNMAAQFLGFAVVLILAGSRPGSRVTRAAHEGLVAASLVYLYFLSCRSVFLALSVALALLLTTGRLSLASLARMLGAGTVTVFLLLHVGGALGVSLHHPFSPEVLAEKALSIEWRLGAWRGTLGMIRDHPLGVGSGNFGDAFIPYQLSLEMIPGQRVLFRTPHNEYLRALAEEGVVFSSVAVLLLAAFLRRLRADTAAAWCHTRPGALLLAGTAFLAVEALFQFPFGTAFGCLMAAVLLGLALGAGEPPPPNAAGLVEDDVPNRLWRISGTVVAAMLLLLLGRTVLSEILSGSRRGDAGAQETACRLNPRNLPACVTAAWLHASVGERRRARSLLLETLQRSPYYHPAVLLLGQEAASAGDLETACHYLWIYDELFRARSAVHGYLGTVCGPDVPPPPPGITMPFYEELPLAPRDVSILPCDHHPSTGPHQPVASTGPAQQREIAP